MDNFNFIDKYSLKCDSSVINSYVILPKAVRMVQIIAPLGACCSKKKVDCYFSFSDVFRCEEKTLQPLMEDKVVTQSAYLQVLGLYYILYKRTRKLS